MTKNQVITKAYGKVRKDEFSQDCFQTTCVRFLSDPKATGEDNFWVRYRSTRLNKWAREKIENNLFCDISDDERLHITSSDGMESEEREELREVIFKHVKSDMLRKIFILRFFEDKKLYEVAGEINRSFRQTERLYYELIRKLKRIKELDEILTDRITTRPIPQRVKWPEHYEDNGPVIKINPTDYVPTAYHPPQHHLPADGNYTFTRTTKLEVIKPLTIETAFSNQLHKEKACAFRNLATIAEEKRDGTYIQRANFRKAIVDKYDM